MKCAGVLRSTAKQLGYQVHISPPQVVSGSINPPPSRKYPGLRCYMVLVRAGHREFRGFGPTPAAARKFAESQAFLGLLSEQEERRRLGRERELEGEEKDAAECSTDDDAHEATREVCASMKTDEEEEEEEEEEREEENEGEEEKEKEQSKEEENDELGLRKFANDCLSYFKKHYNHGRRREEGESDFKQWLSPPNTSPQPYTPLRYTSHDPHPPPLPPHFFLLPPLLSPSSPHSSNPPPLPPLSSFPPPLLSPPSSFTYSSNPPPLSPLSSSPPPLPSPPTSLPPRGPLMEHHSTSLYLRPHPQSPHRLRPHPTMLDDLRLLAVHSAPSMPSFHITSTGPSPGRTTFQGRSRDEERWAHCCLQEIEHIVCPLGGLGQAHQKSLKFCPSDGFYTIYSILKSKNDYKFSFGAGGRT